MHPANANRLRANKAPNRIQKAVRRARCFAKSNQGIAAHPGASPLTPNCVLVIDRKKKEIAVRYFSKADKNGDGRVRCN